MRQLTPSGGIPLLRRGSQRLRRSFPIMLLIIIAKALEWAARAVRLQKKANLLAMPVVVLMKIEQRFRIGRQQGQQYAMSFFH